MINNIPSPNKKLVTIQGATHGFNPPGCETLWRYYGTWLKNARRE